MLVKSEKKRKESVVGLCPQLVQKRKKERKKRRKKVVKKAKRKEKKS
jgi:hypothetical protein